MQGYGIYHSCSIFTAPLNESLISMLPNDYVNEVCVYSDAYLNYSERFIAISLALTTPVFLNFLVEHTVLKSVNYLNAQGSLSVPVGG